MKQDVLNQCSSNGSEQYQQNNQCRNSWVFKHICEIAEKIGVTLKCKTKFSFHNIFKKSCVGGKKLYDLT